MFDWYAKALLKSGKYVEFYLRSHNQNSSDVIKEVFCGETNELYVAASSKERPPEQIVGVNRGEIAAFWLSPIPLEDREN